MPIDDNERASLTEQIRNSIFADLRRAGAFARPSGERAAEGAAATGERLESERQAAAAANPRHEAQPQPNVASTQNIEALNQRIAQLEAQTRTSMQAVQQGATGFGPAINNAGQPGYRGGPNPSDRGSAARDMSLATDGQIWKTTAADVDAMIKEKGYQAAARELRTRLKQDLRGVRLLLPRPGQ